MVEALVWLVEQQHARAAEQGEREVDLLARAARKVPALRALRGREAELGEQRVAVADRLRAREAECGREQLEVLIGVEQVEQPRLLRAEARRAR